MSAPKIPKGWRTLRRGTVIQNGDRWLFGHVWLDTRSAGDVLGGAGTANATYIRLYFALQSFCDWLIRDLEETRRHIQLARVWAWTRRSKLEVQPLRARQGQRTEFD